MSGFLEKYSPSIFGGWQKRFVSLKDNKLKYYKSNSTLDTQVPLGVINFDEFDCTIEHKQNKFKIQISGIDRKFKFRST